MRVVKHLLAAGARPDDLDGFGSSPASACLTRLTETQRREAFGVLVDHVQLAAGVALSGRELCDRLAITEFMLRNA